MARSSTFVAFRRETTYVSLDDDARLRVWIYGYDGPLGRAREIPSGDYLRPG